MTLQRWNGVLGRVSARDVVPRGYPCKLDRTIMQRLIGAIIRNRSGGTSIDHIVFGIDGSDPDKVEAELMKRNLGRPNRNSPGHLQPDTGSGGDIHTSKFKSYHTPDPFGWDLQISNIVKCNRHDT